MRLLIKFPTRGRANRFFSVFEAYLKNLKEPEKTTFVITIDVDDLQMNCEESRIKFARLKTKYPKTKIFVSVGVSGSKIGAVNRGIDQYLGLFDVLLLASDDMIPQVFGYDLIIMDTIKKIYPDTDGCLWFNDGFAKNRLNTLQILGKKYYQRFGYIYHPAYKSFYCDNEFTDIAKKLKKITYFDQCIIKHSHPCNERGATPYDQLYRENDKWWSHDQKVYITRRSNNFPKSIF